MTYTAFFELVMDEASNIARSHFGQVSATVKPEDNNQVLIEADIAIGAYLVGACEKAYPDYNIIDEEAGVIDKGGRFTFVIDPIDGTSNFAARLPHYGIFLGVLDGSKPVAGAIALPAFDQIYTAERGKGTFRNGTAVRVSTETSLLKSLVAYGIDGHQENPATTEEEMKTLQGIVLNVRNLRSSNSAFDSAAVADGRYGVLLNKTTKIWDNVAQQVVIEEAGGVYTDYSGNPMDYTDPLTKAERNFTVCAGAPELHAELQKIIHSTDSH